MRGFLRGLGGLTLLLAVIIGGYLAGYHLHWFADRAGPGTIEGAAIPAEIVLARRDAQSEASRELGLQPDKQILFGDLHVHTTYSTDAFVLSLPILGGTGARPLGQACDFARYCSGIDFWAATEHAEGLTPRMWREIRDSVNQCQAVSGDTDDPDLVSFIGFEWSQVGLTPDMHYGHKNVIFRDLDDAAVSARPIGAAGPASAALRENMNSFPPQVILREGTNTLRLLDFNAYLAENLAVPDCDPDVPSSELPAGCYESAATPADLFARIEDQGLDPLIIPHGSSWGLFAPAGVSWDKQLTAEMRGGDYRLIEIYSGHGNSEEYRPWRGVAFDPVTGEGVCPEPSEGYLPACWRAGVITLERCTAAGEDGATCAAAAAQARSDYVFMGNAGHLAIVGEASEEWLDAGNCTDCFQPPQHHRPMTSIQYGLAISNFDDGEVDPLRFNWGFIGSSDNHTARPGTGYKEIARHGMTEAGGPINETWRRFFVPAEDPQIQSRRFSREELASVAAFRLLEMERQGSFWLTGGLAAVHSEGRSRGEVWDALQRRETYATSGPRILMWFDLLNGGDGTAPMGSTVELDRNPVFRVRAVGAFKQNEGCPEFTEAGLDAERIESICLGECYNPSDERHIIARIEIIRIRPQIFEGEPVEMLIEDPFLTLDCPEDEAGCVVEFTDPEYLTSGRDTIYYARAIQEETMAINAANVRCEYDEAGNCVQAMPCWGDYRVSGDDACLAPTQHRAWASPIYLGFQSPSSLGLTGSDD